jgi:hypothetical protein
MTGGFQAVATFSFVGFLLQKYSMHDYPCKKGSKSLVKFVNKSRSFGVQRIDYKHFFSSSFVCLLIALLPLGS